MDADLDDEITIELRDPATVATRAIVLAAALRRLALEDAVDAAGEPETEAFDLREWLREEGLLPTATPNEMALLQHSLGTLSLDERAEFAWQSEALAALAWSLSLSPLTPPGAPADVAAVLAALPAPWDRTAAVIAQARLHPESEIAATRERAELWYWRANVEALKRAASPAARREYDDAIRDVYAEAVTAGLLAADRDGDFLVASRPVRSLSSGELGALIAASAERLRALNWLCGFGESWDDVPLEV